MVRLINECRNGVCGGSLVSPRVIISAFHCQEMPGSDPCTQGTAILGAHEITGNWRNNNNQYAIKYSDVRFPPNQHEKGEPFYNHNHDISLVVLNEAAQMSE